MGRRVNLAELADDELPSTPRAKKSGASGVTELPLEHLVSNPLNQRSDDEEDLEEFERMVDTVRQHGVLQPLVVAARDPFLSAFPDQAGAIGQARWIVLIGNRRFRAAHQAGASAVAALVNNERIASLFEVMLVENSHRKDLAPLREAEAMDRVLQEESLSQRELAKRLGRTHTYVRQRLSLLGLVPDLRAALTAGTLRVERARELGSLDESLQRDIAAAGPPWKEREPGGNAVSTRGPRRLSVPRADPAAAARSIRSVYSGEQLAELVRLLSEDSGVAEVS